MIILNTIVSKTPYAFITASGSTTICQGDSVILTATQGSSYSWSTGATTQSIIVTTTGNYSCSVNSPNGCNGNANTPAVNITVLPSPATPTITQNNFTLASTVSGTTYQWYLNGVLQTTHTTQFITITSSENGTWWVVVINSSGCSATSPWFTSSVGVNELINDVSIAIYPNPTSGIFIMDSKGIEGEISVYNVFGEKIFSQKVLNEKSEIDLSEEPSGVYFVHITSEQGSAVRKIVINK